MNTDTTPKLQETGARTLIWVSLIGFGVISLLTVAFAPGLVERFYPLPEDTGASWYYWQIAEFPATSRIIVWAAYALHQLTVWGVFIAGKLAKRRAIAAAGVPVTDAGAFGNPGPLIPTKYNWMMTWANIGYVLLHLVQTQLWYGGLAQDVPIWTSQGSVIVMLVLLLVMEMPRRGLFFGKWHSVDPGLHRFLRTWHGPFISWAIVYTFWFHPMEGNWGLMSGFVYMFLLFIQMNLYGTQTHKKRWWVVVLEAFVVIHGTLVTVYKDSDAWPLFLFGFLAMFVITYMYTFSISRLLKLLISIASLILIFVVYQWFRGWDHVMEVIFIPVALYGGAILLWLLGFLGTTGKKMLKGDSLA